MRKSRGDHESSRDEDNTKVVPKARMMARLCQYQLSTTEPIPDRVINATYQHHVSCHTKSCFRCKKSKRKSHVCGPLCECRYRLPDRKRHKTEISIDENGGQWYSWNGSLYPRNQVSLANKRGKYDLFQNVSCPVVSESKFCCNSNATLIMDARVCQYVHKYVTKGTQDEDSEEYKFVEQAFLKCGSERVHDNDRSEALRLICKAAFAHDKRNIISPTLASYLTRNVSRFYLSHKMVYCPLKDVIKVHKKHYIGGSLSIDPYEEDNNFFQNWALNYLCRPRELETLSLFDFTEKFEAVWVKEKEEKDKVVTRFQADTGYFKRPSVVK